ncbi:hypothetical protein [Algoriphagus aquimarinus]|uniref:hypothetical protein n=1 Tax=Algoriphagus aquimarinus TaxID=237018 RepID=UPI0030DB20A3|tara:strand:- start:4337 stop:5290 length:954 start_codon:yes stop_codon:yes gene_type:complete
MNDKFETKWPVSIQASIDKISNELYPEYYHRWPTTKGFISTGYKLNEFWGIIKIKDTGNTFVVGDFEDLIIDSNTPTENPNIENINSWIDYLISKLSIRPQDVVMMLPLKNGSGSVQDEFKQFNEDEKKLWSYQLEKTIEKQLYYIHGFDMSNKFLLAPGYQFLIEDCKRFFDDHPNYEKNVFIMTRYVKGNKLLEELNSELKRVLIASGLNPVRADDKMYLRDRNLWNNVCVYMNCCKYGIAILEDRIANEFNPNVAIEYGYMRALNKPVLLLADSGFRNLRADIIGTLREEFDITDIKGSIDEPINRWLNELNIK